MMKYIVCNIDNNDDYEIEENELIEIIKCYPCVIFDVKSPSEKLIKKSIKTDWKILKKLKNQTKNILTCAVEMSPMALKYADEQIIDKDVINIAVYENDYCEKEILKYIPKQFVTFDIICELVKKNSKNMRCVDEKYFEKLIDIIPSAIYYIKNPSANLCKQVIEKKPSYLRSLHKRLSKSDIIDLLKKDGTLIRYIPHKNIFEFQLVAVKQNWRSIEFLGYVYDADIWKLVIDKICDNEKNIKKCFFHVQTLLREFSSNEFVLHKNIEQVFQILIPYMQNKLK